MELKDYTTEELKEELKRRNKLAKEQKEAEKASALCCRNCKHCKQNPQFKGFYSCAIRTYGKNKVYHYSVKPWTKACNEFERKENNDGKVE